MNKLDHIAAAGLLVLSVLAGPVEGTTVFELVSDTETLRPGESFYVGLRIRLDPGWHTYWTNPGDAGMPTKIVWTLPEGFLAGSAEWPFPKRFDSDGVVGFGYAGEILIPVRITPAADLTPGSTVRIAARVNSLVCSDVCVPASGSPAIDLPVGAGPPRIDGASKMLFAVARAKQPVSAQGWIVRVTMEGDWISLALEPPNGPALESPLEFFPEERNVLAYDVPAEWRAEGRGGTLKLRLSALAAKPIRRLSGVLVAERGLQGPGSPKALAVDVDVE